MRVRVSGVRLGRGLLLGGCVWWGGVLQAQAQAQVPHATPPDPGDPHAQVPAVVYQSPLRPRERSEARPVDWRLANERVNQIGGWRTYARQAQQPAPAASSIPVSPSASAPTRSGS